MKNCNYCKKEFQPTNFKGSEQQYCSKICRNKAGTERYKLKLMNNGNTISNAENFSASTGQGIREDTNTNQFISNDRDTRETYAHTPTSTTINTEIIRLMESTYAARTDAQRFELMYQKANEELNLYKSKLAAIEEEIDQEPEPAQGIAGILENIPEWLSPAIGKLLQHEKVQNFILSQIPEKQ